ncbi:hypothetical protein ACFL6U_24800 [Planctomycetota bacterium]
MEDKRYLGSHKLGKKFFMSLPTGVYLASNCYDSLGPGRATPCFHGTVLPIEEREAQWELIRASFADQRLCDVYKSIDEFKQHIESKSAEPGYPEIVIE